MTPFAIRFTIPFTPPPKNNLTEVVFCKIKMAARKTGGSRANLDGDKHTNIRWTEDMINMLLDTFERLVAVRFIELLTADSRK